MIASIIVRPTQTLMGNPRLLTHPHSIKTNSFSKHLITMENKGHMCPVPTLSWQITSSSMPNNLKSSIPNWHTRDSNHIQLHNCSKDNHPNSLQWDKWINIPSRCRMLIDDRTPIMQCKGNPHKTKCLPSVGNFPMTHIFMMRQKEHSLANNNRTNWKSSHRLQGRTKIYHQKIAKTLPIPTKLYCRMGWTLN